MKRKKKKHKRNKHKICILDNVPKRKKKYANGLRAEVFAKTGGRCYYCAINLQLYPGKDTSFTIDHYYPVDVGGTNHYYNLVPSCHACNNEKANKLPSDYMGE